MDWCERNWVGYVFGLAGNKVLLRAWRASPRRSRWSGSKAGPRRSGVSRKFAYAAQTWSTERRVIARVEASDKGADSCFVVTNLAGTPRWLYEAVYRARARAAIW